MIKTFYSILKIYYLILGIIGVPVNLLAIVILSRGKCGLSTCTTRYLVAMAMADLLVIITAVILFRINFYYFPEVLIYITPVCSVIIALIHAATDCSVWFTVTFTFDRFVAICCQKLKTKYCTEKTAVFVLATAGILLCLKNVPFYFAYEPPEIISKVPWFCYQKPSYYTDPRWLGFDWFDKFLNPLLPIALILLLNALTVRHILVASRVRKGLRGHSKGENCSDPEMESRRKSVILLFTISGSFILLWLVFVIEYLYYTISGTGHRDYSDSEYIFRQVGLMIRDLSCCTNTFIYGTTQAKFREQVKSATWRFVAAAGARAVVEVNGVDVFWGKLDKHMRQKGIEGYVERAVHIILTVCHTTKVCAIDTFRDSAFQDLIMWYIIKLILKVHVNNIHCISFLNLIC
ncbi:probable G-protein coupled receptor 139 [Heterodontus francisci]|uniref:probable G-protein coupled receptor 139 n=1 Tax=Heterodontus francisci TaxID=7792 RepID=UPI00355C8C28